jgi:hypothetical protein
LTKERKPFSKEELRVRFGCGKHTTDRIVSELFWSGRIETILGNPTKYVFVEDEAYNTDTD